MNARSLSQYGLFAFLALVLGVFLVWPIGATVAGGFVDPAGHWTFKYVLSVADDPVWRAGLVNSFIIAAGTTVLSLALSLPLAILGTRFDFPGRALWTSLLLAPLVLPPFVGAIGLRAMLGRYGAVNSLLLEMGWLGVGEPGIDFLGGESVWRRMAGVILMEAMHLYPILYLNVAAALANLDPALEEAAVNLGAGRWERFRRITLPLIMPGVFAGGTIVFIWSFTELGTPLMFDFYTVTPVQIYWGLFEIQNNPRPYALVVVMLALAVGMYLIGKKVLGGRGYAMAGKASIAAQPRKLGWVGSFLAIGAFGGVTLLALLPHIGVVLASFSKEGAWYKSILPAQWTVAHYVNALGHELAMTSIQNSLLYASLAMVLCVAMGLAISFLTVRSKVKGGWILDALAMLPLAVPGLVMAFGYVAMTLSWPFPQLARMFTSWGWDGAASLCQVTGSAPNPIGFLVIAYAVRRLPYVVRAASAGLEQTSETLEEAARNLGAGPWRTLRKITLPLILANLIAGGILAFSFAMLEVSDSLVLAQKQRDFPITKAIFELFNRLGDGPYIASAMGVWGMALLIVTLVGAGVLMGRKMGAVFRA